MFSLSQDLQLACKGNNFEWRKENLNRGIKIEAEESIKPGTWYTFTNQQTRIASGEKKLRLLLLIVRDVHLFRYRLLDIRFVLHTFELMLKYRRGIFDILLHSPKSHSIQSGAKEHRSAKDNR